MRAPFGCPLTLKRKKPMKSMKRLLSVLLVAGLALALAGPAQAHVLSKSRAHSSAETQAYYFADAGEYYGATSCVRRSSHKVRCIIYSYDANQDITCDAYVNVTLSRTSWRVRSSSWYQIDCMNGNRYGV
jgi:hypothetical protein